MIKFAYIRVYVWFKNDKYVFWMWIWLILKKISLFGKFMFLQRGRRGCNGMIVGLKMFLCLSPLTLWVRIPLGRDVLDTPVCDKSLSMTCDMPYLPNRLIFFSIIQYSTYVYISLDLSKVLIIFILWLRRNSLTKSIKNT
jgi:hypothetical protein